MKPHNKFITAAAILGGLNLAVLTGCGGGYVEASSGPAYYGDGPWIDNTVVVEGGHGWYGGHRDNAYVHPVNRPAAHVDVHVDAHSAPHDDHHR